MKKNKWAVADRISDQIIDLLNAEIKKPDFNPMQALAGQLLALMGYIRTAPADVAPASFFDLKRHVGIVLTEMMAHDPTGNDPETPEMKPQGRVANKKGSK